MPLENFNKLMSLYNENGIAAYSEIILGLPGESYETFRDGIESLLEGGQHMSINFFNCEMLKNSIMNNVEYIKKYKIKYVRTEQHQYHVIPDEQAIKEYSDIVVSTSTMSKKMWIKSNILSSFVRTFHNLGLFQCLAIYLHFEKRIKYSDFYESLIRWSDKNPESVCGRALEWLKEQYQNVIDEKGSLTCSDAAFGKLTWPLDEGMFLKIIKEYYKLYDECDGFLKQFFNDDDLYNQLISYQKSVIKTPYSLSGQLEFDYDFYKYFTNIYKNNYSVLEKKHIILLVDSSDIPTDFAEYGKRVIWYGRKGGWNIITNIKYIFKSEGN